MFVDDDTDPSVPLLCIVPFPLSCAAFVQIGGLDCHQDRHVSPAARPDGQRT